MEGGRVAFTGKLEKELKSAKERGKKFFQPLLENGGVRWKGGMKASNHSPIFSTPLFRQEFPRLIFLFCSFSSGKLEEGQEN